MSHREMKEELTCPICMELFRQPRRLPCGHSYCHICIKAMLSSQAEESGSYFNYIRPLVCPECREEVSVDFVKGIEGIPLDFKLSKLVDLFQFMKSQDDSDSGDDAQPFQSVPCPVTRNTSGVETFGTDSAAPSSFPVTSGPTTPLQQPTQSPLAVSAQPASAGSESSPVSSPISPDTHLRAPSSVANPNWQSSSIVTTSTPVSLQSVVDSQTRTNTATSSSSSQTPPSNTASHHSSPTTNCLSPSQIDSGINFNLFQTGQTPAFHQEVQIFRAEEQAHTAVNRPETDVSVDEGRAAVNLSSPGARQTSESDLGAVGGANVSRTEGERGSVNALNNWRLSPLYPLSGEISRDVRSVTAPAHDQTDESVGPGEVRHSHSREQPVDGVVTLPGWVGGCPATSGQDFSVSQSSVSLPAEISRDTQSCHERSAERDLNVCETERFTRAHSVPTESKKSETVTETSSSASHLQPVSSSQSSQRQKTKPSKAKKNRRFLDTSSASDSDSDSERGEVKRATGKRKGWLMTRFLKSLLFSDSSSSECSDESDPDEKESAVAARKGQIKQTRTSASQKTKVGRRGSGPQPVTTSRNTENHSVAPNSGAVVRTVHNSESRPYSASSPNLAGSSVSAVASVATDISQGHPQISLAQGEAVRCSVNSETLPKELTRQTSADHTSVDSQTFPKQLQTHAASQHRAGLSHAQSVCTVGPAFQSLVSRLSHHWDTTRTVSEPDVRVTNSGRICGRDLYNSHIQTGSPPTLYDNLVKDNIAAADRDSHTRYDNNISATDGGNHTIYDNNIAATNRDNHTRYDNVHSTSLSGLSAGHLRCNNILTRDHRFDPCNQIERENNTRGSGTGQARTLYDNIDDSELGLAGDNPVSPRIPRRQARTRDPVTDIESLKTGFEHVQSRESGGHQLAGSHGHRSSPVEHMGELNFDTRHSLNMQTSISDCCIGRGQGYDFGPEVQQCPEGGAGDHPSSYDNLVGSLSLSAAEDMPGLLPGVGEGRVDDVMPDSNVDVASVALDHTRQTVDTCSDKEGSANPHFLQVPNPQGLSAASEEDLEFMENYFDQNVGRFHRGSLSLQNLAPPGVAIDSDETNFGAVKSDSPATTAVTTTTAAAASSSSAASTTNSGSGKGRGSTEGVASPPGQHTGKGVSSSDRNDDSGEEDDEEEDDDDGSHSGTSMLQNKKKPRSRIRKFLTSLLSLSSSSDEDEENYDKRTSSSKSSDW